MPRQRTRSALPIHVSSGDLAGNQLSPQWVKAVPTISAPSAISATVLPKPPALRSVPCEPAHQLHTLDDGLCVRSGRRSLRLGPPRGAGEADGTSPSAMRSTLEPESTMTRMSKRSGNILNTRSRSARSAVILLDDNVHPRHRAVRVRGGPAGWRRLDRPPGSHCPTRVLPEFDVDAGYAAHQASMAREKARQETSRVTSRTPRPTATARATGAAEKGPVTRTLLASAM